MSNYIIYTDSGCDIAPEVLNQWGVKCVSLTFKFDDSDKECTNADMSSKDFYAQMRVGKTARTSAANIDTFKEVFEAELKDGKDILYIGFSSGLSGTYNSGRVAAEELSANYAERTIITIDSLCASAGEGLLVYFAKEEQAKGASLDEVAKLVNELAPKMCHWFSVDDLQHLKRGGRISPATALVGNLLGIKPVLHVDDEGHLINVSKARGRKAALKALADKYTELAENPKDSVIFISHADCIDDVIILEDMVKEEHGIGFAHIADIGPVIGSHAGPGTIAIFYIAKER